MPSELLKTFIDSLIFFGVIQGLFIGSYMLYRSLRSDYGGRMYAFLLLALSGIMMNDYLAFNGYLPAYYHIFFLPIFNTFLFLTGIFAYFKARGATVIKMNPYIYPLFWLAPILQFLFHIAMLFISPETKAQWVASGTSKMISLFWELCLYALLAYYLVVIYRKVYAKLPDKNISLIRHLRNLFLFFLSSIAIIISFHLVNFISLSIGDYLIFGEKSVFTIHSIFISLMCYGFGIFGILDLRIPHKGYLQESSGSSEKPHSSLQQKTREAKEKLILDIEQQKPYLDPELSVAKLAKMLYMSEKSLSALINQEFGQTFNDFINEYRVQEVILKLNDERYQHYDLVSIAQESGFKSKATFNRVFKNITGKTPSQYRS